MRATDISGAALVLRRYQLPMIDPLLKLFEQSGYGGIAALMFLENVFPPVPSELIMSMAGYEAAQGKLSLPLVIVAGYAGSMFGALFWFYIGKCIGSDRLKAWAGRHGRWLAIKPRDIDNVDQWFERHSGKSVFFARMVPAIRTLISVPAGIFAMPMHWFLIYTSLGTLLWTGLLASAGYLLESNYEMVHSYIDPVSKVVVGLIIVIYIYRVATWRAA